MFKFGEKVVCVNLNNTYRSHAAHENSIKYLELGKTYTVSFTHPFENYIALYEIDNKYGNTHIYDEKRFKRLVDIRKYKLNKICDKLK